MIKNLLIICLVIFFSQSAFADDFKLKKLTSLNNPWSLTFINENEILISEKVVEI